MYTTDCSVRYSLAIYDPNDIKNNQIYNCIEVPLVNGSYTQKGMQQIESMPELELTTVKESGVFDINGRRILTSLDQYHGLYIIVRDGKVEKHYKQ